ncbi:MAG: ABC transporter ATP-binding protein [Lachnospiraceae bacterium]|nr:ABC transporter ATP-binding protein [Lachnospiraceae bacterium]
MDALHKELLTIENLKVDFETGQGTVHAVRDVNINLTTREILGIVGESGSGKSVSMLSLMNLLAENGRIISGSIRFEGRELSPAKLQTKAEKKAHEKMMMDIRGKEIGMVFQDPMTYLNPVLKIETQMTEGIRKHLHCSKEEARNRAVKLLKQVGISNPEKRLKQYPYEFSGGMRQRIIIATALACEPKLLIADEPTTALDVTVQAQILKLIESSVKEMGASAIVITHDLGVVAELCDRIVIMYGGEIVEQGTVREIFNNTRHPYTKGLLNSIGKVEAERTPLRYIPGTPPNLLHLNSGCTFCSRCENAMKICKEYKPCSTEFSDGHSCKCWLYCKEKAADIVATQDAKGGCQI